MAAYSVNNGLGGSAQNMSGSYKTLIALTANGSTSARIYEILIGSDATPGDYSITFDISAQTAAGTSTLVTPVLLDPTSRSSAIVGNVNFTAEGTITAASSAFYVGINQRGAYRWVAAPGGEIVLPITNNAGYALRAKSASGFSGTITCQIYYRE